MGDWRGSLDFRTLHNWWIAGPGQIFDIPILGAGASSRGLIQPITLVNLSEVWFISQNKERLARCLFSFIWQLE
jgi:hypothetical protein